MRASQEPIVGPANAPLAKNAFAASARPRLSSLVRLSWLFLRRPRSAVDELAANPAALQLGLLFLLFFLTLYSAVAGIYDLTGRRPPTTPLALFSSDHWYFVQMIITIPIGLVAAFAYSGIAYSVCRAFGGRGTFDATFASSAFSLHLPMLLFMWVPEMLIAPLLYARSTHALPWPAWVELCRMFLIPLPWAGFISALALSRIHQLGPLKAGVAVVLGAAPTALVTAAFLR